MCSCTEDKEVIGNVIIGRNKVTCQECLDANVLQVKEREKQEVIAQLNELDRKSIRAIREGDTFRIAEIEKQVTKLRSKLV